MSIELVEKGDIHLDYSDVYTNKNSRISTTENAHKRIINTSTHKYKRQSTLLNLKANRFHSNMLLFSLSDQTTLFDLYTHIKVQCYKDAYHIQKPLFTFRKKPTDYIPPQPKNPLSCIVHQLVVVNKNDGILIIPPDPTVTIEVFMKSNPDYFNRSYGRYEIYILDEYAMQMHSQKSNKILKNIIVEINTMIQKYLTCVIQR
jgi:hypothetical protein